MANEAKVVITGDASGLVRAAGQGEQAVGRLASSLGALQSLSAKALSFTVAGVGAAAVAHHFGEVAKAAVEAGDQINKMAQKTGMGAEEISKLAYAAELSDVSTEQLTKGLTALAVQVAAAGTGSGDSAKLFEKLGISVRNADGTMKSSGQVLSELADVFAIMPDGVEKTNLAVSLFGKKIGAEMIPLLNQGATGLKAMGDEAEKFGLVFSGDFAKRAEDFNDNLKRLEKLSRSTGIAIASELIPPLNKLMTQYLDAKVSGLSFLDALFGIGLSDPTKGPAAQLDIVTKKIDKLKQDLAETKASNLENGGLVDVSGMESELQKLENLRKYYAAQAKREQGDDAEELSTKLIQIGQQRTRKLAELEQLRKIAAGEVSADILKDDAARTDEQIKNAQKLKDALQKAWETTRDEAKKAGEEATKLFEKAADVRQAAKDKASAIADKNLTPEQASNKAVGEFQNAAQAASFNAAVANAAALDGRTEVAKKAAEQAAKDAERAMKFAEKITDDGFAQKAIEQAGDLQAKALESQAKQKQQEQADLTKRAEDQARMLTDLDGQITALQTKAAGIKIAADITAAQGALATLEKSWDETKAKIEANPATPKIIPQSAGGDSAGTAPPGFARGGYTGPGGKYQPAGIVHAGEYVLRQEVVRQPGALAFLARLNQVGLKALQGYSSGGLVGRLPISAALAGSSKAGGVPVNLYIGGNSYSMNAAADVVATLKHAIGREALRKGGR